MERILSYMDFLVEHLRKHPHCPACVSHLKMLKAIEVLEKNPSWVNMLS